VRVLIAEDEAVSRRKLAALFAAWGFEVEVVSDGEAAWHALQQEDPPRLAILDWMMPGMDGPQICREVRKLAERPYIYLLLLTGRDRKDDIAEGLEAGADEYLCKPFDSTELKARVRAACRVLELHGRINSAMEQLRIEATHDALTGAWNRAAILDILNRELARGVRQSHPTCAVIADIDYFKKVNDAYGHLVGDAVLRAVSQRLQSMIRPYDALGRYGGEEFLIVAPASDLESGKALAERLRVAVSQQSIETTQGPVQVTVSFGVAAIAGNTDLDSLIHAADVALYRAKNAGRNRVEPARLDKLTEAASV
jgi:two-component system cell cycle response regulator